MPFTENAQALQGKLNEEKAVWDAIDIRVQTATDAKATAAEIEKAATPTADEGTQLKAIQAEIVELDARCAESKDYETAREANEARRLALKSPQGRPDFGNTDTRDRQEVKSLGREWVESKEFQDMVKTLAPGGQVSESMSASMIAAIGAQFNYEAKNLITGAGLTRAAGGSGMVRPDYQGVVPLFLRPLTLRDIVTVGQTGSDLVEFTQVTSFQNAAAPTAEATSVNSSGVATGGLKPQSGLTTALVTAVVKTIPHYIPVTRRAIADAPQMETYINNFLIQGAEIVLEDQMIVGNNVGENFMGLDNTPGITLQSFSVDLLTTTRKARTKVRTVGRAVPTAYVMNPLDWESMDLTVNLQGNYYFGGPLAMGMKTLWGLPVVESEAVLQGTFYVGDMKQAVLWDRERANIRMSDAPNDYFLRNLVAILCELRAAFGVLRPSAIVRGDFTAGPNS